MSRKTIADCKNCSVSVFGPASMKENRNSVIGERLIRQAAPLVVMLAVFIVGLVFETLLSSAFYSIPLYVIFLGIFFAAGWKVLLAAFRGIIRGKVFDENFLMTIAGIGAIAIGAVPEAAGVMLFFAIGQFFEELAVGRSRKSIRALMDIRPDFAHLKTLDGYVKVDPATVNQGDIILVKPGERVPLDGVVETGTSTVDTSALTGESMPRSAGPGGEVPAGSIVLSAALTIKVIRPFGESAVSRILNLTENALALKAPAEKFITKFARYYTPVVVGTAALLAVVPPFVLGIGSFSQWLYRALVLLVISCPCALVLSVPLAYFAGIGAASKRGVLFKGSAHFDTLANLSTVVFDKTGTLTEGSFAIQEIFPRNGVSSEDILFYAAHVETNSNHPLARAIRSAYPGRLHEHSITRSEEYAGYGVKASVLGKVVLAGNDAFLHKENIPHTDCGIPGSPTYIAIDGAYAGYILAGDSEKKGAAAAIGTLKTMGVHRIAMLTGDSEGAARRAAEGVGIQEYHAHLLPEDKVTRLLSIKEESPGTVAFVGDGINDAPVLAAADIGIAMGAFGSDAAVETADVVIMTDDPRKVPEALHIAKKTRSVVLQTIVFVLAVKSAFIAFGAFGVAGLWEAVFADVGVALLAVLNALRVLRSRED